MLRPLPRGVADKCPGVTTAVLRFIVDSIYSHKLIALVSGVVSWRDPVITEKTPRYQMSNVANRGAWAVGFHAVHQAVGLVCQIDDPGPDPG